MNQPIPGQIAHDNRSNPRHEADFDADVAEARQDERDSIAHTEIVTALTNGRSIKVCANGHVYKVDASDVTEELNPEAMLCIADLMRSGDAIEAGRIFAAEWSRCITQVADKNQSFRADYTSVG